MGALRTAVMKADVSRVRSLLETGHDPDDPDEIGRTALDLAIDRDNSDLCSLLLDFNGGTFLYGKQRGRSKQPDLAAVCGEGLENVARCLLERGFDPGRGDAGCGKDQPLHAALKGHGEVLVPLLLRAGADPSSRDVQAKDALAIAIENGCLAAAAELGREADQRWLGLWRSGRQPYHAQRALGAVAATGSLDDLGDLIKQSTMEAPVRFGGSALFWAAARGDLTIARALLTTEAPIGFGDPWGRTPLWAASRYGRLNVLKLLLDRGASVEWTNPRFGVNSWDGTGPLWQAAAHGHIEAVSALLAAGASDTMNKKSRDGALGAACRAGHEAVVEYLLHNGFDPNGIPGEIREPAYTAGLYHHQTIQGLLSKFGAALN